MATRVWAQKPECLMITGKVFNHLDPQLPCEMRAVIMTVYLRPVLKMKYVSINQLFRIVSSVQNSAFIVTVI